MKQLWPNRFWERGGISDDGKQLWYSREVMSYDRVARQDYENKVDDLRSKREEQK